MGKNRFIHYGFVLTVIAVISAGILSVVNGITSKIIADNEREAVNAARRIVLPRANDFKEDEIIEVGDYKYIPGYDKRGKLAGYVVSVSEPGYAANIDFVMGFDTRGRVMGLNIINSQETPGLGSKILDPEWQKKARGKDSKYEFDNSVDGFAGATISPRAVYKGIKKVLTTFENEVKN